MSCHFATIASQGTKGKLKGFRLRVAIKACGLYRTSVLTIQNSFQMIIFVCKGWRRRQQSSIAQSFTILHEMELKDRNGDKSKCNTFHVCPISTNTRPQVVEILHASNISKELRYNKFQGENPSTT